MQEDLKTMFTFKRKIIAGALTCFSLISFADEFHYKDMLLGGRASTMGGAYTAISDDASGSYYNPAGLALSQGDSLSGSAKVFNDTETTYKETIEKNDWVRNSNDLIANFFGVIKKLGEHTLAFSMSVEDATSEYQDQVYSDLTSLAVPIDKYLYNLHKEDNTDLFALSYAHKLGESFSFGVTFSYYRRRVKQNFHYLIEYANNQGDEMSYINYTQDEDGLRPKLGIMWAPSAKWSFGAAIAQTVIFSTDYKSQADVYSKSSGDHVISQSSSKENAEMPMIFNLGAAYFASPFLLFSFDFDYYTQAEDKQVTWNISGGMEYYWNQKNVLRSGFYTNNSNAKEVEGTTNYNVQHMDLYGVTVGYTNYSKDSSVTLGLVYSMGSGKVRPYSGSLIEKDISRRSISIVTSADYGF